MTSPVFSTIPFADIPPNSLIVVRAHEGVEDEAIETFRAKVPASVTIILAKRETDVMCITEDVLNAAGWYKRAFA